MQLRLVIIIAGLTGFGMVSCGPTSDVIYAPIPQLGIGAEQIKPDRQAPSRRTEDLGSPDEDNLHQDDRVSAPDESSAIENPDVTVTNTNVNAVLFAFYSKFRNYDSVTATVKNWFVPRFGSLKNSCVAFMSTALRLAGFQIPELVNDRGESTHTVTKPFSDYLEKRLGWTRIKNADSLISGDIVFTKPNDNSSYPAHTYMFHSWVDKTRGTGLVIDNQGFLKSRNITGYNDYQFTPFSYALRHKP